MKKFFAVFLMASVLAVLALPVLAAVDTPVGPGAGYSLPVTAPISSTGGLIKLFEVLTNWVFALFTFLAVIFLVLAALQFVTAGGDAVKVGEARMKLIWAAVGIMVALASKGFIPIIESLLGVVD
ncbi:MAG: hypothetical protein Q7S62_01450 [bacterium]|nr:hypothetical protein [bacterium]